MCTIHISKWIYMFRLKIHSKPYLIIVKSFRFSISFFDISMPDQQKKLCWNIIYLGWKKSLNAIVYCFEKRVMNDLQKDPWSSLKIMSRGLLVAWSSQCFAFLTQLPWVLFARSIPFLLFIIGVFQVYHLMGHNQWTFNFASLTLLAITWICIRTGPSRIAFGASEFTQHTLRHYL